MDSQKDSSNTHRGQAFRAVPDFPPKTQALNSLIADLQIIRDRMVRSDRRRRSGVLAGQFLILARQYAERPPSRKTVRRFFHLIARDGEAA